MEKPKVAGTSPEIIEVTEGVNMAWCACGMSANQPWCDGSHRGTGIRPVIFKEDKTKKAAMCMCKQSQTPPYCDGSHTKIG